MVKTTLRHALPADAAALGELHVASWRETYAGLVPDEMLAGMAAEVRAAMWREILGDPAAAGCTAVFVLEDGDRVVGLGSCGRQRDAALGGAGFGGEIGALYVLRPYQGRGAGRALMAAMAGALLAAGQRSACLWVLRENAVARRFYAALGGVVVAERAEERSGATLAELAYGWHDLSSLAG